MYSLPASSWKELLVFLRLHLMFAQEFAIVHSAVFVNVSSKTHVTLRLGGFGSGSPSTIVDAFDCGGGVLGFWVVG